MRIGRVMIDTDSMSIEDMNTILKELCAIRARKLKAEELKTRMMELLTDARENGFTFIDQDSDQIWTGNDIVVYDER